MINENAIALLYRDILGVEVTIEKIDKSESSEELGPIDEYISHLIDTWKEKFLAQEELYDNYGIDLLAYNENTYSFFRKTVLAFFANEAIVDLFQWYCTDRNVIDDEEDKEAQKMWDENDNEIDISTNAKFISYMKYLSTFNGVSIDQKLDPSVEGADEDEEEND